MLNKFEFIGNLVADPEQRIVGVNNDTVMTKIRIAVDRDRKYASQEKTADFFDVATFGKLAGLCFKWLKKGREVYVVGRIQPTSYIAKDGSTAYTFNFVAENVIFLRGGFNPENKEETSEVSVTSEIPECTVVLDDGFMPADMAGDEVPFNE